VEKNVIALLGDSKLIIENSLQHSVDRVIMPLPEKAKEYLPYAHLALKSSGGWIHYHDFVQTTKNEDPLSKLIKELKIQLYKLNIEFWSLSARKVRSVGPNKFHVVVDIHVKPVGKS
ncbi:class I SAM-dependent methyltransferase family protein, partial [Candidatus Bathyarchaeota archaeon]